MLKDTYYLERIFGQYYDFILSGGTALYLFLAMHRVEEGGGVTYTVAELEKQLKMSHASIRKYEIVLVMVGLLDIEVDYYHMYTHEGYQIKQKKYTLYEPLTPDEFKYALAVKHIPQFERIEAILPDKQTNKYEDFKEIYRQLSCITYDKLRPLEGKTLEGFSLKPRPFRPYQKGQDIYSIERLFDVYSFLPYKVILFYLYLWRYWIKSENISLGIHIARKQLKKELGYGDEQIREAMYQLCAVGLLDLQKDKYYRYFLISPLADSHAITLRPTSAMYFLFPKNNLQKKKYIYLYEELQYLIKRNEKTM